MAAAPFEVRLRSAKVIGPEERRLFDAFWAEYHGLLAVFAGPDG